MNDLLGSLVRRGAELLEDRGHKAKPFAATKQAIDWNALTTRLPHKTVATRAGFGWIGKCALLVTKPFGSALRIATVLTDAPLPVGTAAVKNTRSPHTTGLDHPSPRRRTFQRMFLDAPQVPGISD